MAPNLRIRDIYKHRIRRSTKTTTMFKDYMSDHCAFSLAANILAAELRRILKIKCESLGEDNYRQNNSSLV
jgi:uncharacterized protein YutD